MSGQQHAPAALYPPGKTRYPLYRRLGGPQRRSGSAENLVLTGTRFRTVQSLAQSLYRLSYRAHTIEVVFVIWCFSLQYELSLVTVVSVAEYRLECSLI